MYQNKEIALVTGATGTIGQKIAKELSKNGKLVIGSSRTKNGVKKIKKILNKSGEGIIINVKDPNDIKKKINFINTKFGSIDILINNIGINYNNLLSKISNFEWEETLKINLTSVFYLSQSVIKKMIKKRKGRIITIGSIIGSIGNSGQISYSSSKSALIGFHKSLALEVASRKITVNIVSPGFIISNMTKKLDKKQLNTYLLKIPMQRFGKASDIANVVLFLSSNKSSYITGQVIHVNGGMQTT
ncbi:3-oxoacyl-[acyl-carrier-protein] reductase FabG [Buchnera aphidicola (Tetraneura ulmi)]|uniref:3-oxoacyl-ACP reductase FabG n=1 Tax=Buchnera aphidicola TaxID=9 RepID=UPI0034641398